MWWGGSGCMQLLRSSVASTGDWRRGTPHGPAPPKSPSPSTSEGSEWSDCETEPPHPSISLGESGPRALGMRLCVKALESEVPWPMRGFLAVELLGWGWLGIGTIATCPEVLSSAGRAFNSGERGGG